MPPEVPRKSVPSPVHLLVLRWCRMTSLFVSLATLAAFIFPVCPASNILASTLASNVGLLSDQTGQHPQILFASVQDAFKSCSPSSDLPLKTFSHLAQYSPWFPAAAYTPPPEDCRVDQVHLLHRHSSRFPTAGAGRIIQASIKRLQKAIARKGPASSLSWLLDYSYDLGNDDLVSLGIRECAYAFARFSLHAFDISFPMEHQIEPKIPPSVPIIGTGILLTIKASSYALQVVRGSFTPPDIGLKVRAGLPTLFNMTD